MRKTFKDEKKIRDEDRMEKITKGRKLGLYLKVYIKV